MTNPARKATHKSKDRHSPWTSTTARHPCPLCGGTDCLTSSVKDPAAVTCIRVASGVQVGAIGHLHELRPSGAWAPWRMALGKLAKEDDANA